jgi:putative ABC transport system substrate-binding protein
MFRFTRRQVLHAGLAAASAGPLLGAAGKAFADTVPDRPFRIVILTPRADIGDVIGFQEFFQTRQIPAEFDIVEVPQPEMVTERIPAINADRPDLVMTVFTPATLAAVGQYDDPDPSRFITDIPVVFSSVTDPMGSRVVPSLDRPGRNVTGTSHIAPAGVQLNTILAYRPIQRIAVVYNPGENNMVVTVGNLRAACSALGLTLMEMPLPPGADGTPSPEAIPDLIATAKRDGAELIYIGPDTLVASRNNKLVADAALEHQLPTFCATELPIRSAPLLMGLVSRATNVGRFAAFKASEILLNGRSPSTVPVQTLDRFSLIVRIEVARRLNLYPPMRLLNIAEVIRD